LVVQCRETDTGKRADLVDRLQKLIREELAIECFIELVPLHTLPRTSSGKLSRSKARQNFIEKHQWQEDSGGVLKEQRELNRRAG
jgi:fatty-acyl-CoA synthase